MLNIVDIIIDSEKTVGKNLLLTAIRPYYEYNGAKKSDNIIGYKYEIVMPERKFEKINVKIVGTQRIDFDETSSCLPIILEGLQLKVYWMSGTYNLTATANNVKVSSKKE